jgi:PHD/YefM family antitoxin component YafN of YafNO toxin-antitoxin module
MIDKETTMREITANEFRKTLKEKVDSCIINHEVLKVTRKNGGDFVIIGESDWSAIEETLYLNRIPGLVESIHQAAAEDFSQGTPLHEIKW